jgi:hypothetical protein
LIVRPVIPADMPECNRRRSLLRPANLKLRTSLPSSRVHRLRRKLCWSLHERMARFAALSKSRLVISSKGSDEWKRDKVEIFFCLHGQGQSGAWHSVFVNDVDSLDEELKQRGAKIVMPVKDEPLAVRELHVEDPDGQTYRFSQGKET